MNSNDALLHEWEKEKFTAYEAYCATMDAEKEVLVRGIEKGIEEIKKIEEKLNKD